MDINYTGPRTEEMGTIEFTPGEVTLVQARAGAGLSRFCAGNIVKLATELHCQSVLILVTEESLSYMRELIATSCDVDNINVQVVSDYNEAMNTLGGYDVLIIDNITGLECQSPDTNGETAMNIISDIKRIAVAQNKSCVLLGQLPDTQHKLQTPEHVDQHVVLTVVGSTAIAENITTGVTISYKCDLKFSLFEREGVR